MEFVLNTTISTPESSGGVSSIMFGDYREEDVDHSKSAASLDQLDFQQFSSDSDDDLPLLHGFNEHSARDRLIGFPNCTRLVLTNEQQRNLGLEIGVNVTEEHPWKQVKKQKILDYLSENETQSEKIKDFRAKLRQLDNDDDDEPILVGYVPALSTDGSESFLFFEDEESAKAASRIIQQFEAYERRKLKKILIKYPRPWKTGGSEKDVDLQLDKKPINRTKVEIQRLCLSRRSYQPFEFRFADDVRDGYVELISKIDKTNVLTRRRVNVAVQTAPRRIDREQQTDPTFPANAWSQYFYEIAAEDEIIEENKDCETDEQEEEDAAIGSNANSENPSRQSKRSDLIVPSDAVKELLQTLEFNSIDMYRNDYAFIAKKEITKYTAPYLTEIFCFTEPTKCSDRYVCALDWNPASSGVFVVSYTFNTINTSLRDNYNSEGIDKELVMSPNPVLVWSFDDTLYPKLELDAPREITCLSYCPYDENIIIGGMINGQLIIWDLKNRMKFVENGKTLSDNQERNRTKLYSIMNWPNNVRTQHKPVRSAAITPLELSHKKAISSIKWLNRKHFIASTGQIQESLKPNEFFRQFISTSLDGTISFWDLDYIDPNESKNTANIKKKNIWPESMREEVSEYERLNGIIRPIYTVLYDRPITNLVCDEGRFSYQPKTIDRNGKILDRIAHSCNEVAQECPTNKLIASSLLGNVGAFVWEGFLCKEGKPEQIKQIDFFETIHNGPVINIERNPFALELLLTIGQNIFAIWSDSYQSAPLFWRKCESKITHCQWSATKPSIFFIIRADGIVELWDILTRTNDPCIAHNMGGKMLTILSQHKLSLPNDVIVVGDHKGTIRVLSIPLAISRTKPDDLQKLREFAQNEINRKEVFNAWQTKYAEDNADLRNTKQLLRDESRKTIERFEKASREKEETQKRKSVDAKQKTMSTSKRPKVKLVYDFADRLTHKWETMNVKRLMSILLSLKHFDPEVIASRIKPERDRLAYNVEKEKAIAENFRQINDEVSNLRCRLMPPRDINQDEERLKFITKNVDIMLSSGGEKFQYKFVEQEMNKKIEEAKLTVIELNWHEILAKARERRTTLNKALIEKNTLAAKFEDVL